MKLVWILAVAILAFGAYFLPSSQSCRQMIVHDNGGYWRDRSTFRICWDQNFADSDEYVVDVEHRFANGTTLDAQVIVPDGHHFVWPQTSPEGVLCVPKTQLCVKSLAMQPRLFEIIGLWNLSSEPASYVREVAQKAGLQQSVVVGQDGTNIVHNARTSRTVWLSDFRVPWLQVHRHRLVKLLHWTWPLTIRNSEALQVVHYEKGNGYDYHYDSWERNYFKHLSDEEFKARNHRFVSVFYYLSNVTEGGFTHFPRAMLHDGAQVNHTVSMYECKQDRGVAVEPAEGKVVMWYNLDLKGNLDTHAMHAGCPIIAGTKWVANFWVHDRDA